MAGVKGRSGRKPNFHHLEVDQILALSNEIIIKALKAPDTLYPLTEKASLAKAFILKRMPERLEVDDRNALPAEEKRRLLDTIGIFLNGRRNSFLEAE